MKKLFLFIIAFSIALGLAACAGPEPLPPTIPSTVTAATTESITFDIPDVIPPAAKETTIDLPVVAPPVPSQKTAQTIPQGQTAPPATTEIVSVTIPEGFTFYQIAKRLEASRVCSEIDFSNAAHNYQIQSFPAPIKPGACYRLEGMLYPDTYNFYVGEDPTAVLRKMLNNYAEKSGLPDYDTLILASIIERETRSSSHMAMVSSVFHNRLRQGMRLQADATIVYVEKNIKANPLVPNPEQYAERYNTYKCAALPEGPICSPGRSAIEAAKHPSQSDYLYYFFGKDQTNHYTKTFDEHKAAMNVYGVG